MISYFGYKLVLFFNYFVCIYVVILVTINIIQIFLAYKTTRGYKEKLSYSELSYLDSKKTTVPFSILIPAHNEEITVINTVHSLLQLSYNKFEILVIDDGSTDNTLNMLIQEFNLKPTLYSNLQPIQTKEIKNVYKSVRYNNLTIIEKENGGKSDALNAGINFSSMPYILCVDADSILDSDTLLKLSRPFLENRKTVAVGGTVRPVNSSIVKKGKLDIFKFPKNMWAKFQQVEYSRAFTIGRMGWAKINASLIISGAIGAFNKKAVVMVGGYSNENFGEDMDLVLKIHLYFKKNNMVYNIAYVYDAICWTQVPEHIKDLYSQRTRWSVGLMDALFGNFIMFFPKYKTISMLSFPFYFFFEFLAPVVEIAGFLLIPIAGFFGLLSIQFFIIYVIIAILFGILLSLNAIYLDEFIYTKKITNKNILTMFVYLLIENVFYRYIILFFRFIAIFRHKKYKQSWKNIKREDMSNK